MRGCATRGASGASTLPSGGRPAIRYSGVEFLLEGHAFRDCSDQAMLNVGSDAAETDQPARAGRQQRYVVISGCRRVT